MDQPIDILILSNGPGELATWVKPVVAEIRRRLGNDRALVRISVVLSPDNNASGQEVAIAQRYPEVDRVQGASHFLSFLLWGKTQQNWDWRSQGVVVFLGGDQFFPVMIGKRLGYSTVVYAEWEARWHSLIDRFGIMHPAIADSVASRYAHKFTVVGDLMAEAGRWADGEAGQQSGDGKMGRWEDGEGGRWGGNNVPGSNPGFNPSSTSSSPLIGLLPGSKAMKLTLGVPLTLAIAEQIHQVSPEVRFVIPVAPTLDVSSLAAYADPQQNPVIQKLGWTAAELVHPQDGVTLPFLKTPAGLQVGLWTEFPAYELLAHCSLCLTTIGANTAELGSLAVPMLVLIPTQQLEVMRAWDGVLGLLANLPGVGVTFAYWINKIALGRIGLLAWPNIWAKAEIVPELVGELEPAAIAQQVLHYLSHPEMLEDMSNAMRKVRGEPGAAEKLVQIICEELDCLPKLDS